MVVYGCLRNKQVRSNKVAAGVRLAATETDS